MEIAVRGHTAEVWVVRVQEHFVGSSAEVVIQFSLCRHDTLEASEAEKVGFDPAVMASPFITTIVDAISLLVYFQFASMFLGIG